MDANEVNLTKYQPTLRLYQTNCNWEHSTLLINTPHDAPTGARTATPMPRSSMLLLLPLLLQSHQQLTTVVAAHTTTGW
jgi:hypothetical protein